MKKRNSEMLNITITNDNPTMGEHSVKIYNNKL